MAAPVVSYYNAAGTEPVTEWTIGEIDAGSESDHITVTVWNNKEGSSAVSHMKNVTVTVVNDLGTETGGQSDVVVAQGWIHAIVNDGSVNDDAGVGTPLGGAVNYARVCAVGVDPDVDGYIIKGDPNDGTIANSANNCAKYELWVSVPPNAPEGDKPCRIRTGYSYT